MMVEWPIAVPGAVAADQPVTRTLRRGGGRLATVTTDFFLDPAERLSERERALMTGLLHGLLGAVADEIRVRLPADLAERAEVEAAELATELAQVGLLQREDLVRSLLRSAEDIGIREAAGGDGARRLLQQWTAHDDADVAASAMALLLARGRSRDRFSRPALSLSDLPTDTAAELIHAVAACLASRSGADSEEAYVAAATHLIAQGEARTSAFVLEARLVAALDHARQLNHDVLLSLAAAGEAALLAQALALRAGLGADDSRDLLLGGGQAMALLLRLAGQPRETAAGIIAAGERSLGITDPVAAIESFDRVSEAAADAYRSFLQAPSAFRHAREALERHG